MLSFDGFENNDVKFNDKMSDSIGMFKRTKGIDPLQQWKVILQKMLPI